MKIALVLLAVCIPAVAQTAKVVELSAQDAASAKELYKQEQEIDAKIKALEQRITETYLAHSFGGGVSMVCGYRGVKLESYCLDSEWQSGFLYSEDYRFVVPKPPGKDNRLPSYFSLANPVSGAQ